MRHQQRALKKEKRGTQRDCKVVQLCRQTAPTMGGYAGVAVAGRKRGERRWWLWRWVWWSCGTKGWFTELGRDATLVVCGGNLRSCSSFLFSFFLLIWDCWWVALTLCWMLWTRILLFVREEWRYELGVLFDKGDLQAFGIWLMRSWFCVFMGLGVLKLYLLWLVSLFFFSLWPPPLVASVFSLLCLSRILNHSIILYVSCLHPFYSCF